MPTIGGTFWQTERLANYRRNFLTDREMQTDDRQPEGYRQTTDRQTDREIQRDDRQTDRQTTDRQIESNCTMYR